MSTECTRHCDRCSVSGGRRTSQVWRNASNASKLSDVSARFGDHTRCRSKLLRTAVNCHEAVTFPRFVELLGLGKPWLGMETAVERRFTSRGLAVFQLPQTFQLLWRCAPSLQPRMTSRVALASLKLEPGASSL
jgi:hypothetical protein